MKMVEKTVGDPNESKNLKCAPVTPQGECAENQLWFESISSCEKESYCNIKANLESDGKTCKCVAHTRHWY
jgi:hypothetical protein